MRDDRWVSKTDIIHLARCPYAFWLVDSGEVRLGDVLGPAQRNFIDQGLRFEDEVRSSAIPLEVPPGGLAAVFGSNATILGLPLLENRRLRIYGKPDGVETDAGALVPIEIKSHRDVRRNDRLELAFYWLLLAQYRTRNIKPRGVLILRDPSGAKYRVEIEIHGRDIEQARELIKKVRVVRQRGVDAEICSCEVCSTRPEVFECVLKRKGTTLIYGVAGSRARALSKLGIRTLDDISDCDPACVAEGLRRYGHFVTELTIGIWKYHALSYREGKPMIFGEVAPVEAPFIAIDFEYDSARLGEIYLVGAAVVREESITLKQWWGDEPDEIRENLQMLSSFVADHPGMPVISWSGESAEMPELTKAAQLYGIKDEVAEIRERHLDIFRYAERNVRLPIPTLDLKSVGKYFKVARRTEVSGGMAAAHLYHQYRLAKRDKLADQVRLREVLLDYNCDDIEALVAIAQHLLRLHRNRRRISTQIAKGARKTDGLGDGGRS
jgi:predicted RecB family nuclease